MPQERVSSLYLATHIRRRRPAGRQLADVGERPVPIAKLPETPTAAAEAPETPLQQFTVDLSVAGSVTRAATGNFLRYNKAPLGTDGVTVRLKNGAGDTSNAAVSLFPGQRIRRRRFTHVEITVPAGLAGTAEFVYSTFPPGEDVDIL